LRTAKRQQWKLESGDSAPRFHPVTSSFEERTPEVTNPLTYKIKYYIVWGKRKVSNGNEGAQKNNTLSGFSINKKAKFQLEPVIPLLEILDPGINGEEVKPDNKSSFSISVLILKNFRFIS